MKNTIWIAIIIVIVIAAIVFFGKYNTSMNSTVVAPSPTSSAVAPDNVTIQNFAFNPQTLTVKAGTTVTWTNNESTMHNIRSETFNSVALNTGDTFKFTFNSVGKFDYNCGIHPTMTGTIIVQ